MGAGELLDHGLVAGGGNSFGAHIGFWLAEAFIDAGCEVVNTAFFLSLGLQPAAFGEAFKYPPGFAGRLLNQDRRLVCAGPALAEDIVCLVEELYFSDLIAYLNNQIIKRITYEFKTNASRKQIKRYFIR